MSQCKSELRLGSSTYFCLKERRHDGEHWNDLAVYWNDADADPDRRIEALTKALREAKALIDEYVGTDDTPCEPPCEIHRAKVVVDKALASAAGAKTKD